MLKALRITIQRYRYEQSRTSLALWLIPSFMAMILILAVAYGLIAPIGRMLAEIFGL